MSSLCLSLSQRHLFKALCSKCFENKSDLSFFGQISLLCTTCSKPAPSTRNKPNCEAALLDNLTKKTLLSNDLMYFLK